MKMKTFYSFITLLALLCGTAFSASAQDAAVDSTLLGKSIMNLLPSKAKGSKADVTVHQSQAILNALNSQTASNSSRRSAGYRVRIFNDNKQDSRGASEAALGRFKGMFPNVSAYRTYTNPYFRVTVGDFRTKSEALALLQQVKGSFPTAFIVKETINYPINF